MTITTYSGLQETLIRRARRTDIQADVPDCIILLEERLGRELLSWYRESLVSLSATSGTAQVSLTSNCERLHWIKVDGDNERTLTKTSPENAYNLYADVSSGVPTHYYEQEGNIILVPTPGDDYTLSAYCTLSVSALTTGNPTNTILTNYPGLYLHGSLVEVYRLIRNPEQQAVAEDGYQRALFAANTEHIKRKNAGTAAPRKNWRKP